MSYRERGAPPIAEAAAVHCDRDKRTLRLDGSLHMKKFIMVAVAAGGLAVGTTRWPLRATVTATA